LSKEKVLWIYSNMSDKELEGFIKMIDSLDLPYSVIITNRKLSFLSKQDITEISEKMVNILKGIRNESKG